jgi:hypothetical protein
MLDSESYRVWRHFGDLFRHWGWTFVLVSQCFQAFRSCMRLEELFKLRCSGALNTLNFMTCQMCDSIFANHLTTDVPEICLPGDEVDACPAGTLPESPSDHRGRGGGTDTRTGSGAPHPLDGTTLYKIKERLLGPEQNTCDRAAR